MANANHIVFHSVISSIQKVALYESKTVSLGKMPRTSRDNIQSAGGVFPFAEIASRWQQ